MECKDDDKAFIFTLKNPHGVEPTRFMKKENDHCAIICNTNCGPIFVDNLFIGDNCNKENSCFIINNGKNEYECNPEHKASLYVNTANHDKQNHFSVLDYEVYCIDFDNQDNINKLCKHPDIIWRYIETNNTSEQALKQLDDDTELLNDLDTINCDDSNIRLKISHYYFKNPSEFLPNTQIVSQQYDAKLKEWLGNNYKWRLLYRASEHGYTAKSFHNYCDDKGPTLVIIKSSRGWIFGGYTTQSWQVVHPDEYGGIYYE